MDASSPFFGKYDMEKKKISVMAPHKVPWSNVELVKECIIIPYLLYKYYGYEVTIVGKAPPDIPPGNYDESDADYLSETTYSYYKYVKGLKLKLLEAGDEEAFSLYLEENSRDIDIYYMRGPYEVNMFCAPLYKKLRPDGMAFCALDANSGWMDRIYWYNPIFLKFMNSCDVISTSCTRMADFLSIKWPWKVHSIINGFYDLSKEQRGRVSFEGRENIILTVGRLGTYQKATEVLMEAFAKAAYSIPDWKLYLAGSIEPLFETYIERFKDEHSDIMERIVFTGTIKDRDELAALYNRSKVYALTSTMEGGTNNATAEALGRGLIPVTSRIDAYEDITDKGRLGRNFEIGDTEALKEILIETCNREDLREESDKVYNYAEDMYDMVKITGKLNELFNRNRDKNIY